MPQKDENWPAFENQKQQSAVEAVKDADGDYSIVSEEWMISVLQSWASRPDNKNCLIDYYSRCQGMKALNFQTIYWHTWSDRSLVDWYTNGHEWHVI